jgi:hypothetical protein
MKKYTDLKYLCNSLPGEYMSHLSHFLSCNPVKGLGDDQKLVDYTFDPITQTMTFWFTKRRVYLKFIEYLEGTTCEIKSKGQCDCPSGKDTCVACRKSAVPSETYFFHVISSKKIDENRSLAVKHLHQDHFQYLSLSPEEVAELMELTSLDSLAARLAVTALGFYPSQNKSTDIAGMSIWCVFQNKADKERFWNALLADEALDD